MMGTIDMTDEVIRRMMAWNREQASEPVRIPSDGREVFHVYAEYIARSTGQVVTDWPSN
jgi:hypothetical protein